MNEPIQNRSELLDAMWADMLTQQSLYRPGPYWERKAAASVKMMHRMGLGNFRGSAIGTSYADNVVLDPMDQYLGTRGEIPARIAAKLPLFKRFFALHRHWINAYYQQAKRAEAELLRTRLSDWFAMVTADRPELPPTLEEGCPFSFEMAGGEYATYYLKMLSYISVLEEGSAVDFSKVTSVIEVGGGIGANLHLLLTRYPNIRKVVLVDIPTTLYVSTQYLKKFFPLVRDYTETREAQQISFEGAADQLEIITICPWQLPHLQADMDLAWNSNSFVEMSDRQVDFYCEQFRRLLNPQTGKAVFISYDDETGGSASLENLKKRIDERFSLQEQPAEDWSWWWKERLLTGTPKN